MDLTKYSKHLFHKTLDTISAPKTDYLKEWNLNLF